MKLDSQQLRTLATILHEGSFEAAAKELGITQPAVSQRLKALEETVGTLLVKREIPCAGTAAGRRLAAHADQVAALERSVIEKILPLSKGQAKPINIAVNADSLSTWFMAALSNMQDFEITFLIDNQNFSDELLRRGEVVGAVTANATPIAGCDCVPLGSMTYAATATPAFIQKYFANGVTVESLKRAPMLRFNVKDQLQEDWIETHFGSDCHPPCHSIGATDAFLKANLIGLGWGMNPTLMIKDHLASGALQMLRPNSELSIPHFWQTSRIMQPVIGPLTDAIRQTARQTLPQC